MTEKRGGARKGAGRPPLNLTRVTVQMSDEQIGRVGAWRKKYRCKTFSDALRQILDSRWLRRKLHNPVNSNPG